MRLWAQSPLSPGIPHSSGDRGLAAEPCRGASVGQLLCRQRCENHQPLKHKIILRDYVYPRFLSFVMNVNMYVHNLPFKTKSSSSTKLTAMAVSGQIHNLPLSVFLFWRRDIAYFVVFVSSARLLTCCWVDVAVITRDMASGFQNRLSKEGASRNGVLIKIRKPDKQRLWSYSGKQCAEGIKCRMSSQRIYLHMHR